MKHPTVLLTARNAAVAHDLCTALSRFGYDTVTACDGTEALAMLKANGRIGVVVADVDAGGLALAREARAFRPDVGVVYTAAVPHRIAESAKVSGAPIVQAAYRAHQLVGVIAGLGRRVLDDPLAA